MLPRASAIRVVRQQFCGDYAGFAQEHLEEELAGVTALYVAGCGGDANPNPRREVAHARRHGRELGDAVMAVLKSDLADVHEDESSEGGERQAGGDDEGRAEIADEQEENQKHEHAAL